MQLNYNLEHTKSFRGMMVDNRRNEVVSAAAGEDLQFGVPVYVSDWSGPKPTVMQADAAADLLKLFGFTAYEPRAASAFPRPGTANEPTDTIIKKDMDIPVLVKGVIWTDHTNAAIVAGQVGVLDTAANNIGKLKSAAATGTKTDLSLGATGNVANYGLLFLSAGAAGALVKLQVNLPNVAVKK